MMIRLYCVRTKGLEPPRLTTLDPKSSAATNYATCARITGAKVATFLQSCKYFCIKLIFQHSTQMHEAQVWEFQRPFHEEY